MRRTEHELLEQVRRDRLAAPGGPRAADDAFRLEDLRAALGRHDALVEYGVQGDELFACIATRGGVSLHRRLASWPAVMAAIRALRFQIDTLGGGAAHVQSHLELLTRRCQSRLQQLHALVWAPLAASLTRIERVLVVPHGALGSVPFAALHDGAMALGSRHALALAPSARGALRGLPHVAHEAEFIAGLFEHGPAQVGEAATRAALEAGATQADVIHLACHAVFRADNPRFSALRLHGGPLTVDLVEALRLGPCTVVLGACESGLGDVGVGDETVGLVRAFLVAGAARVLAMLSMLALEASAATIRVTCEASPARSKVSVDGKSLAAGQYSTVAISGASMAAHPAQAAVGGEVETDYDSNPKDIAAGAIAIPPSFITGGQVTGKVLDAAGNTVASDSVICRVKRR